MLRIQNFHQAKEYQDIYPEKNIFSGQIFHEKNFDYSLVKGFYSKLGGHSVLLYKYEGLYLRLDDYMYPFSSLKIRTQDVSKQIENGTIRQVRHITIEYYGTMILDTDYDEISLTFEFDPTPFIEDEDFDFGLFLEILALSPERQERIFSQNT